MSRDCSQKANKVIEMSYTAIHLILMHTGVTLIHRNEYTQKCEPKHVDEGPSMKRSSSLSYEKMITFRHTICFSWIFFYFGCHTQHWTLLNLGIFLKLFRYFFQLIIVPRIYRISCKRQATTTTTKNLRIIKYDKLQWTENCQDTGCDQWFNSLFFLCSINVITIN